jgi:hypothetical protein
MLTGIYEVDQAQIKKLLRHNVRRGANLLTFGAAGTGKTEMAMQACDEEGFRYVYLNLSILEAPDLIGLPIIDEETKTADYALPKMLPAKLTDAQKDKLREEGKPVPKPVILLVDEADKAKPELQNPMLELFQFRTMNGRELDIHAVIATGNLPDEGAFSQPMSHALTNRCSVYKVTTAFEPWQEWAAGAHINPLIVGFLSRNQSMLLQKPPEGDDTAYCHPSPRAWTLAARDLDAADKNESVEFQELLVSGRVGTGAATKFKVWLTHYREIEPKIDELVKNGTHPQFEKEKATLDRILVCAIAGVDAIMDVCRQNPKDGKVKDHQARIKKIVGNVMNWVKTLSGEICIGAMKSTFTMPVIQQHKLTQYPDFMEAFVKVRKAMNAED